MIVSAAKAGALIAAMEIAAIATVDRIPSFFDTDFLPKIFHFCDGGAWRAFGDPSSRLFKQADFASSLVYRGKIPAPSQMIIQSA
jgi:hypothetical protein